MVTQEIFTGENALPNEEAEEMRGLRTDVARNEFLIALNCRRAARRFSWLSSLKARGCVRGLGGAGTAILWKLNYFPPLRV